MTWGTYYFFYDCPTCGKHYRWCTESLSDPSFGECPACGVIGTFVGETKDLKQGETRFDHYEFTE